MGVSRNRPLDLTWVLLSSMTITLLAGCGETTFSGHATPQLQATSPTDELNAVEVTASGNTDMEVPAEEVTAANSTIDDVTPPPRRTRIGGP